MRDGGKARKEVLAAYNSRISQQLAGIQKQVPTVRGSLSDYPPKWSSDIDSGFHEFFRCLLYSACDNVQSRWKEIQGSFMEALALFEHICEILEFEPAKKIPNA